MYPPHPHRKSTQKISGGGKFMWSLNYIGQNWKTLGTSTRTPSDESLVGASGGADHACLGTEVNTTRERARERNRAIQRQRP